jgi:hypothetical protein
MPPLAVDPPSATGSPVGVDEDRGRLRGRDGRRASFQSTPSEGQLKMRRSKTENDLEVESDDPISPKDHRNSLSPARFLSKRWSRAKKPEKKDESPHDSRSPGRRFGRRNKEKAADKAGAAQKVKASKSVSPGPVGDRRRGSIFKSLKSLLASPSSTRPERQSIIAAANKAHAAESNEDAARTSFRENVGPLPFLDTDDEGNGTGRQTRNKPKLKAERRESGSRRNSTNAPTAEITVVNLDAWDTDDDDTEKSEPKNLNAYKAAPASPAKQIKVTKTNDNNATPITKNTKKEKGWEAPLVPPKSKGEVTSATITKQPKKEKGWEAPLVKSRSQEEKEHNQASKGAVKTTGATKSTNEKVHIQASKGAVKTTAATKNTNEKEHHQATKLAVKTTAATKNTNEKEHNQATKVAVKTTATTKNTKKEKGWEAPLAKYRAEEEKQEIQEPKGEVKVKHPQNPILPPAPLEDSFGSSPSDSSYKVRVSEPGRKDPLPSSLSRFRNQSEPSIGSPRSKDTNRKNHSSLNELSAVGGRKKVEFGSVGPSPGSLGDRKKERILSKVQNAKSKASPASPAKNQDKLNIPANNPIADIVFTPASNSKAIPATKGASRTSAVGKTPSKAKTNPKKTKKKVQPSTKSRAPAIQGSGWNRPLHEQADEDDDDSDDGKVRPRSRRTSQAPTSKSNLNMATRHNSAPALSMAPFAGDMSMVFPDPAIDSRKATISEDDEEASEEESDEKEQQDSIDPLDRWRSPLPKPAVVPASVKKPQTTTKETPSISRGGFLQKAHSKAFRDREMSIKRISDASQDSFLVFPDPPSEWLDTRRTAQSEGETVEELNMEIDDLLGETEELREQLSAAWSRIAVLTKPPESLDPPQVQHGDLQESGGCMADDEHSCDSSTDLFAAGQETELLSSCDLSEAADIITMAREDTERDDTEPHDDDPQPDISGGMDKPGLGTLIFDTKSLRQELEAANDKFDALANMQLDGPLSVHRSKSAQPVTNVAESREPRRLNSAPAPGRSRSPISMIIDMSNSEGHLSANPSTKSVESVNTIASATQSTSPISKDSLGDEEEQVEEDLRFSLGNTEHDTLCHSYGSMSLKQHEDEEDEEDDDEELERRSFAPRGERHTNNTAPSSSAKDGTSNPENSIGADREVGKLDCQHIRAIRSVTERKTNVLTFFEKIPFALKDPVAPPVFRFSDGSRNDIDEGLAQQQHDLAQQLEAWRVELEEKEDHLSQEMRGVKGKNKDMKKRQEEMDAMFQEWKRRLESKEEELKETELKAKLDKEDYARMQADLDKSINDRTLEQNDMRRKISRVTRLHMELNVSVKNKVAKIAVLVRDLCKVTVKLEEKSKDGDPIGPELRAELRGIQNRIKKQVDDLDKEDLQVDFERGHLSSAGLNSGVSLLQQQTSGLKKETGRLWDKINQKKANRVSGTFSMLQGPPRRSSDSSVNDSTELLLKEVKTLREENKALRSSRAGTSKEEVAQIQKSDDFVADLQAEVESLLRELSAKASSEGSPGYAREQLVLNSLNRALVVKLAMEPTVDTEDAKKRSAAIRSMKREFEKLRNQLIVTDPEADATEPEADARPSGAEGGDDGSCDDESRGALRGAALPQIARTNSEEDILPPVYEDKSLHVGLARTSFIDDQEE